MSEADWYEEMEKAEEERNAQEYECFLAYRDGYIKAVNDFIELINAMPTYKNESGEEMPMPVDMMGVYLIAKLNGYNANMEGNENEGNENGEN